MKNKHQILLAIAALVMAALVMGFYMKKAESASNLVNLASKNSEMARSIIKIQDRQLKNCIHRRDYLEGLWLRKK